jgi:hypothetical protein
MMLDINVGRGEILVEVIDTVLYIYKAKEPNKRGNTDKHDCARNSGECIAALTFNSFAEATATYNLFTQGICNA